MSFKSTLGKSFALFSLALGSALAGCATDTDAPVADAAEISDESQAFSVSIATDTAVEDLQVALSPAAAARYGKDAQAEIDRAAVEDAVQRRIQELADEGLVRFSPDQRPEIRVELADGDGLGELPDLGKGITYFSEPPPGGECVQLIDSYLLSSTYTYNQTYWPSYSCYVTATETYQYVYYDYCAHRTSYSQVTFISYGGC